jgi:hypothetical protein
MPDNVFVDSKGREKIDVSHGRGGERRKDIVLRFTD